jgi:hypothetical protein
MAQSGELCINPVTEQPLRSSHRGRNKLRILGMDPSAQKNPNQAMIAMKPEPSQLLGFSGAWCCVRASLFTMGLAGPASADKVKADRESDNRVIEIDPAI